MNLFSLEETTPQWLFAKKKKIKIKTYKKKFSQT